MLSPIARHEAQSKGQQWQDEHANGRARVDISPHQVDEHVVAPLPQRRLEGILALSGPQKVQGQVQPDEEKETAHIAGKIRDRVAVIPHGRIEVCRPVALDMMMFDVVVVVGVPGVAHQWINDVGKQSVEDPILWGEDAVHVDVLMLHECVCACEPDMQDPMQQPVDPVEVVAVHPDRAGNRHSKVDQQMSDHDHICRVTGDFLSPGDIGI